MKIRIGGERDVLALLAMCDDAVAWLTGQGLGGQWGTRPWSADPTRVARVRRMATEEELWIAEADDQLAGALILTEQAPVYIPPADGSELYILFLITAREFAGKGIGRHLLDHADRRAHDRQVSLMRVDCWAGADGTLVNYYRAAGFTPTVGFTHHGWAGQVLERSLLCAPDQPRTCQW